MVKYLLALTILLSGCASVPRFSSEPQDCDPKTWGDEYPHDLVNYAKAVGRTFERAMPYICVDEAEVIRLPSYLELLNLPPAKEMPVVAVYKFMDLTGQRKELPNIASFSTAVTQGESIFVIDALKKVSGGDWFQVVEREGLDNLVKERQLIRSTRDLYDGEQAIGNVLKPLLFAGLIIEGGIVGFDSNIQTGGQGARYLGIGVSEQYRVDQVTVAMRLVSVQTGEILLTTQVTKTIASHSKGGDVFTFVDMNTKAVELESGVSVNEPVTYAIRTAIEFAVLEIIHAGEEKQYWKFKEEKIGIHNNVQTN